MLRKIVRLGTLGSLRGACSARPLLGDPQVGELRRAVEDVCHHRPGGMQPFLAARILLARACFLLALEYHQRVHLAGVLLVLHHQRPDQPRSRLLSGPELVMRLCHVFAWLQSHRDELRPHIASLPDRGQILLVSKSSTSSGTVNPSSRAMPWTWRTWPRNQRSNGSAELPRSVNAAARSSASVRAPDWHEVSAARAASAWPGSTGTANATHCMPPIVSAGGGRKHHLI